MLTNIILILPLQPNSEIVVPIDQVQEPLQQLGALLVGDPVNVLDVPANRVHALPPGDWVGAHNWINGLELGADVLRGLTGLVIELEPSLLGDFAELWLFESCREGFKELLVRLADLVVEFVP